MACKSLCHSVSCLRIILDTLCMYCRCVEGSNLFVCGSYVYNHYVDCRDSNYYLSSDKINDVVCLPPQPDMPLCPVLACQDNTLRALKVLSHITQSMHYSKCYIIIHNYIHNNHYDPEILIVIWLLGVAKILNMYVLI